MKWGLNDLGSVLATLQGRQEQAKLFHQSEKANSAFELTYRDDPQKAPFFMSMSRQEGATKNVKKVTIPVTHAEAAILETALRAAITRLIGLVRIKAPPSSPRANRSQACGRTSPHARHVLRPSGW
jgi:hypothetical protein